MTDDPVQIKHIGDACTEKEAWFNARIETLFKVVFFKFAQNRALARKLLATGDMGLYEATTDRFYGCGVGYNSKRWALGDWTGKNVTGKILMRVREILKKKSDEGVDLSSLSFNYSPPSLRHERAPYLLSHQLRPPVQKNSPLYQQGNTAPNSRQGTEPTATNMEIDQPPPPQAEQHLQAEGACTRGSPAPPPSVTSSLHQGIERRLGDLSILLENLENDNRDEQDNSQGVLNGISTQAEQTMYTTVHNWSTHHHSHSHSIPRNQTNIKHRPNPPRGPDSLTQRERDYIFRTEEDTHESNPIKGYDRGYGHRQNEEVDVVINNLPMPGPSSSTPRPGNTALGGTPKSYLDYRLNAEKGASPISEGIKRKTVRVSHT